MEKSLIHFVVPFPACHKAPVISKPSIGAFDFPAALVTPKSPSILKLYSFVLPRRRHKFNASVFKFFSEGIRIISFVTHQMLGCFPELINRLFNQRYLMWTGRGNGHSQRNTSAVRHNHELGALATLGFPDFWAPFFAETKVPSIKHSLQSIWPLLSSLRIKVRHIFSQTPCSSHNFNRLQQVLGLGYFSGRSFHLAPVRRIQRMPSKTKRLSFQGRPLLFNFGSSGSTAFHCFSVKYIARLIGLSSYEPFIGKSLRMTYETASSTQAVKTTLCLPFGSFNSLTGICRTPFFLGCGLIFTRSSFPLEPFSR